MFAGFEKGERWLVLGLLGAILAGALVGSRTPDAALPIPPSADQSTTHHATGVLSPQTAAPTPAPTPRPRATPTAAIAPGGRIDLNRATAEELQLLPGVGPAKSEAILADRDANGPFRTVDDLDRVAGFGAKTIARLRPYLAASVVDLPAVARDVAPVPATPAPLPIRINHVGVEELDTLPGVGPAIARRIVEYRAINGPFRTASDLARVKGIGPSFIEKNRGRLVFD